MVFLEHQQDCMFRICMGEKTSFYKLSPEEVFQFCSVSWMVKCVRNISKPELQKDKKYLWNEKLFVEWFVNYYLQSLDFSWTFCNETYIFNSWKQWVHQISILCKKNPFASSLSSNLWPIKGASAVCESRVVTFFDKGLLVFFE